MTLPNYMMERRVWLGTDYGDGPDILATLTDEQRRAVKAAMRMWVLVAQTEGYEPILGWRNFLAEVDHSALLDRLLNGDMPFRERPPKSHSYPDYAAAEAALKKEEQDGR